MFKVIKIIKLLIIDKLIALKLRLRWRGILRENIRRSLVKRSTLERDAIEGNSPVSENHFALLVILLKYFEERTP